MQPRQGIGGGRGGRAAMPEEEEAALLGREGGAARASREGGREVLPPLPALPAWSKGEGVGREKVRKGWLCEIGRAHV